MGLHFLQLPCEIRFRIYSYLAPNQDLDWDFDPSLPVVLRNDGEPCWPAVLRTNRAVYEEAIAEWYAQTRYHARLDLTDGLTCFRLRTPIHNPPPPAFTYIKFLDLTINLSEEWNAYDEEWPEDYDAMVRSCFPRGACRNLRSLKCTLVVHELTVMKCLFDEDSHADFLPFVKSHIQPFYQIYGLSEVDFTIQIEDLDREVYEDPDHYGSSDFTHPDLWPVKVWRDWKKGFRHEAGEVLAGLKRSMSAFKEPPR